MCMILDQKTKPRARVAKDDIICYKVLDVINEGSSDAFAESPYRYFKYSFNRVYRSRIEISGCPMDEWYIEEGLHSFVSFKAAENEIRDNAFNDVNQYIFVAVIPKGSKYYIGDFNGTKDCYVSDALMVLRRDSARSQRYIRNLPPRGKKWKT